MDEDLLIDTLDELDGYSVDEWEDFLAHHYGPRNHVPGAELRRIQEALLQGLDPEDL